MEILNHIIGYPNQKLGTSRIRRAFFQMFSRGLQKNCIMEIHNFDVEKSHKIISLLEEINHAVSTCENLRITAEKSKFRSVATVKEAKNSIVKEKEKINDLEEQLLSMIGTDIKLL